MKPTALMGAQRANACKPRADLLEKIRAIRACVGDGLNDDELTRLLRATLLSEAGFTFVSFSAGYATLSVPEQELDRWYPREGWLTTEKEQTAKKVAAKYGWSVYQPVDTSTNFWHPLGDSRPVRHHLEMADQWQTVVAAHPLYLKIRLYGKTSEYRDPCEAQCPLALGPDLLSDLSALYAPEPH